MHSQVFDFTAISLSPRVSTQLFIYYNVFMIMISGRKAHSSIDCEQPASRWNLAGNTTWAKHRLSITHTWNERSRFQSTFIPQGHPVCARVAMGEPHNFAASISRRGSTGPVRQGVRGKIDDREIRWISTRFESDPESRRFRISLVKPSRERVVVSDNIFSKLSHTTPGDIRTLIS